MTEKQKLLYYYIEESDKTINQISKKNGIKIDSSKIWQILTEYFDLYYNPCEIIYKKLDSEKLYDILVKNYLHYLSPLTIIEFDYTIIPENLFDDSIIKGIIKFKGEIWEVHKNDKDEFPSNPHAHNYEYGIKLHLGTGALYKKKKIVDEIRLKDLLKIRHLIEQKISDIILPTLIT